MTMAMAPALSLRPYQEDVLAASAAALERGVRRQAVALPTGTGKTIVFPDLIDAAIAQRGRRW